MLLSDARIAELIGEPKPTLELGSLLPPDKRKGAHRERQVQVTGENGSNFRVIVRQTVLDPHDFSVILAYEIPETTGVFRLRRHNGDSHDHPNRIEGDTVRGFHVHIATERYQLAGYHEDGYAEATDAYGDLAGATQHILTAANFEPPAQETLGPV